MIQAFTPAIVLLISNVALSANNGEEIEEGVVIDKEQKHHFLLIKVCLGTLYLIRAERNLPVMCNRV